MTCLPTIRPLQSGDREAVRRLCGDTADGGEPVERFFSDRTLVVDLLTRYYTDFDRSCSWVADAAGQMAGYVLAAASTEAAERVLLRQIVPRAMARAVLHGALFRAETWRMLVVLGANRRGMASRQTLIAATYPAHVHINISAPFRRQGLGGHLLNAALESLRRAHIRGVHANVRADNPQACRFFAAHGFAVIYRSALTFPVRGGVARREVVVYGYRFLA